jgi:hypothetical protein
MVLGLTQPLTETTENVSGSKARPARKAVNLTAMYKMWGNSKFLFIYMQI